MKKIYEIRLTGINEDDLFGFFFYRLNKDHNINHYYVSFHKDFSNPSTADRRFAVKVFGWGIYSNEDRFVGQIKITNILDSTILTFEVVDKKDFKTVLAYIEAIKSELLFSGINVLRFRDFLQSEVLPGNRKRVYIPVKGYTLEKWKKAYSYILELKDEAADTDDDEIYIPKLLDYRDRLIEKMNVKYGTKTISRIMKAGEAGLLG